RIELHDDAETGVAFLELNRRGGCAAAHLIQRRDQAAGLRTVARCRPVVSAEAAGTYGNESTELRIPDLLPVRDLPRLLVDFGIDVLVHGFHNIHVLARAAIELPQKPILADGQENGLVILVDQHTLEYLIEIQGFGGDVLKIPLHPPRARI